VLGGRTVEEGGRGARGELGLVDVREEEEELFKRADNHYTVIAQQTARSERETGAPA
jgi:hypothetical protein